MPPVLLPADTPGAVPVHVTSLGGWDELKAKLPAAGAAFAEASGYKPKPGAVFVFPGADGALGGAILGIEDAASSHQDPFLAGALAALPPGRYRLEGRLPNPQAMALAFVLGCYSFDRYRKGQGGERPALVAPEGVDVQKVQRIADGVSLARDLINTPTSDLGPQGLEEAIRTMAGARGAKVSVTAGDELLARNFPMIHAVGRASAQAPRLIDLAWGDPSHPKVTLVGKGVCFDTGGLDIKSPASMLLMKKDMGGAAAAIATAQMAMDEKLPIRLRLLVPAVENSISANAFRPGDVLHSRKGLTVEIGNTDAEGRLVLADALALADEEEPDLIVDFATLTGAARVALGPDLPPLYTSDDALAQDCQRLGLSVADPVWRMPLWPPYDKTLASRIADMNNVATGGYAGSVIAAMFLKRFVEKAKAYAHFDIFGWNPSSRPGRPEGGECQGARLVHALLCERYGR